MKVKHLFLMLFLIVFSMALYGCAHQGAGNAQTPKTLLDTYFSSAVKQDYAKTYTCYYKEYQDKITREEYIKHRKEASVLQDYKIVSIKENGNLAHAEVVLTFAPSKKFHREKPVIAKTTEDLIKENGNWKVKVW